MLSPEFDELNLSLGKKLLEKEGYQYENGNWHLLTETYQLSFILGKDKNASHDQVKYLTIALRHLDVPMGDEKVTLKPFNDIDKAAPVQISPFKVGPFVTSELSQDKWKYVSAFKTVRDSNTYYPIYYGGLEKWVLKDKSFTRDQNLSALSRLVSTYGAKLMPEEETEKTLRRAMVQVAKYASKWAEFMSPNEILRQLRVNGEDYWIEKQWIGSYSETFSI